MDSKAHEHPSDSLSRNWSDYVELSKYFSAPVKRCRSTPCLPISREQAAVFLLPSRAPTVTATTTKTAATATGTGAGTGTGTEAGLRSGHGLVPSYPRSTTREPAAANLSLSWQLACNPADADQRQEYSAQRQQIAGFLHCKGCRQADAISLSSIRARPKKKISKKQDEPTDSNGDMTKIVVVDANMLRAYWNQQQQESSIQPTEEREPQPKKIVLKIKNPYAVPLCERQSALLGPKLNAQRQRQLDEEEEQQQQYSYPHPKHCQAELHARRLQPLRHLIKESNMLGPKYAVPVESMFDSLKKGSRYCGNFYYK